MVTMDEISFDKEEFNKQLRARLTYLRETNGYKLKQVAKKVGLTHVQVHNHETGVSNVYAYHIPSYARTYKKPESYFFDESNAQIFSELAEDKINLMIAARITHLDNEVKLALFELVKTMTDVAKKEQGKQHAA